MTDEQERRAAAEAWKRAFYERWKAQETMNRIEREAREQRKRRELLA